MDERTGDAQPTKSEAVRKKHYVTPVLQIYGNLREETRMLGTSGNKDGAFGQMNVRTQP